MKVSVLNETEEIWFRQDTDGKILGMYAKGDILPSLVRALRDALNEAIRQSLSEQSEKEAKRLSASNKVSTRTHTICDMINGRCIYCGDTE